MREGEDGVNQPATSLGQQPWLEDMRQWKSIHKSVPDSLARDLW